MVWDKPQQEKLSAFDRQVIGQSKRISIPLAVLESGNLLIMRDAAEALRCLATAMEIQSRLENKSEKEALSYVAYEIMHTNRKIKAACRRYDVELLEGRPPDSRRKAKEGEKERTSETVLQKRPLHVVSEK